MQHHDGAEAGLVDALAALYAHVYGVTPDAVRLAARERATAMAVSGKLVADGRDPDSPVLADERAALVRCLRPCSRRYTRPDGDLPRERHPPTVVSVPERGAIPVRVGLERGVC